MEVVEQQYKDTKIGKIPVEWEVAKLSDFILEFKNGAPLKPSDFIDDGIKVLSKIGIIKGGILTIPSKKQQYCSASFAKKYQNSLINEDHLIVVLRDLVPSGPSIGLIVKYEGADPYILAQGTYGFKIKLDYLSKDYLIQLSNSMWYRKYMHKIMVGSTQVHITNPEYKGLKLPLPPLPEQKKIAAILSTVDEQIATTTAIIQQTQQLKKGLMQQLFSKGIGHTTFKKTKIGEIPESWEVKYLFKICKMITDGAHFSPTPQKENTGYKIASVKDIRNGKLNKESCANINETDYDYLVRNNCKADEGDVLLTKDGSVGRTMVWGKESQITLLSSVGLLRLDKEQITSFFLKHFLDSGINQNWLKRLMGGSALQRIILRDIKKLSIPLPPLPEQKKIATILTEVDDKIQAEQQQKARLEELKKGLMQVLLTGQVRVKT